MNLLVTGASGYIGHAFTQFALKNGADVLTLLRRKPQAGFPFKFMVPNDWENQMLLSKTMEGRDAVVHCAGLAHNKTGDMWEANLDLTVTLAEAAKQAGVKRFIFISTAAVFGEAGVFDVNAEAFPTSEYGHSKFEAENALVSIFKGSGTKFSIIRPPMVVGPLAPGRAETLRRVADKLKCLPFGALRAERSYIHIDELTSIIWQETQAQGPSALVHGAQDAIKVSELTTLILEQDNIEVPNIKLPAFIFKAAAFMPHLATRLEPLLHTHILVAGRKELDHIV